MNDASLFDMAPNKLEKLRLECIRSSLGFFKRRSIYYSDLLGRAGVDPRSANINDLARIIIPSDALRGDGQSRMLIQDVEEGGMTFSSSGTSGKEPIRLYRSPLDLAMMALGNTSVLEYAYGGKFGQNWGIALFMGPPQLSGKLTFLVIVETALGYKHVGLSWGMDLKDDTEGTAWQRLVPNQENLARFFRDRTSSKAFFTAPAGLHMLNERMTNMRGIERLGSRLAIGAPPIDLGPGGFVLTGGGMKDFSDLPPLDMIIESSKGQIIARDRKGNAVEPPFIDGLGMTEALVAMMDRHGVMDKVPHPLSQVFLMDPRTFEVIGDEDTEGLLGIFNPFTTSWMECVLPGDVIKAHRSPRYYGREFVFVRRMAESFAGTEQRACGGELEDMIGGNDS